MESWLKEINFVTPHLHLRRAIFYNLQNFFFFFKPDLKAGDLALITYLEF